ncbi:MAG: DDE-type integrase/transposase/recombinase [Planctomycetaceae bacterium]|nr:DDE-type integrase/transposase/recombinase [Planctomycetaceae bacterium]
MKQLTRDQRCAIIRCLVDGVSIRATTRITGFAKGTIQKLTIDLGEACMKYHEENVRNVNSKRLEVDEIWNFCYAKDKNVPDSMRGQEGVGSMWTWTAIDADSKLIVSWLLGARDSTDATTFMRDAASRLANRVQLTSDGLKSYLVAVDAAFAGDVDFSVLVKTYGKAPDAPNSRYSPPVCTGCKKEAVVGNPNPALISTSYVERQNLNIRMQNRRFTRLTNAFSKKASMLAYSLAITFMYHNFVRVHQTLKATPAMAAGIAAKKWTIEDMVDLIPELNYNTRPRKGA